jgi:formate dehydrogenase subunit beta
MDDDEIGKEAEAKETDAEEKGTDTIEEEIELESPEANEATETDTIDKGIDEIEKGMVTTDKEPETEPQQEEPASVEKLGAKIAIKDSIEQTILNILSDALAKNHFDAILIPHKVPTGDSYVYLLIKNPEVLTHASPIAPIMSTQGARALSSVTHLGTQGLKIAAVMRPCETRAAIELSKLDQNILDDVTLFSMDCPGVLPTKVFNEDPAKGLELFETGMNNTDTSSMRPACQVCDKPNSATGDLHVSKLGVETGNLLLIQNTKKGEEFLTVLGLTPEVALDDRNAKVEELIQTNRAKCDQVKEELTKQNLGLDNLLDTFSNCLKCHNCMRVCPMDYCQSCYFESDDMKFRPEEYFARAATAGSLRFPVDSLQYHLGRMLHMSMSCVACGTCEDACPMSLPISQIYSNVADKVQQVFDYTSGLDPTEPRPLSTYEPEEFTELEG